jgi:2-polyprenyl-3-methyl-5-hydroxy-6-metoxy-1,4-benzoquinol methylase
MTKPRRTREPQYQVQFDDLAKKGSVPMGPTVSELWRYDPRHLAFLTARYKFVSKMLSGKTSALEVGCGDGFGMRLILQEVGRVHGVDFDPMFADWAREQARREGLRATFSTHDLTREAPPGKYDAAYSLDVIEHVPQRRERRFLRNICSTLKRRAVCIIGTPNVTAKAYQSKPSRIGHINLKSHEQLRRLMIDHFHNVFMFSMNDEVVHTGFSPMAHYLLAVGVDVR